MLIPLTLPVLVSLVRVLSVSIPLLVSMSVEGLVLVALVLAEALALVALVGLVALVSLVALAERHVPASERTACL